MLNIGCKILDCKAFGFADGRKSVQKLCSFIETDWVNCYEWKFIPTDMKWDDPMCNCVVVDDGGFDASIHPAKVE